MQTISNRYSEYCQTWIKKFKKIFSRSLRDSFWNGTRCSANVSQLVSFLLGTKVYFVHQQTRFSQSLFCLLFLQPKRFHVHGVLQTRWSRGWGANRKRGFSSRRSLQSTALYVSHCSLSHLSQWVINYAFYFMHLFTFFSSLSLFFILYSSWWLFTFFFSP